MTKADFGEFVTWVLDRWPNASSWAPEVWVAMYQELQTFDPAVLYEAARRSLVDGAKWPPNTPEMYARCVELTRQRAVSGPGPALPAPQRVSWAEYAKETFGEYRSLPDVASDVAKSDPK